MIYEDFIKGNLIGYFDKNKNIYWFEKNEERVLEYDKDVLENRVGSILLDRFPLLKFDITDSEIMEIIIEIIETDYGNS